MLKLAFYGKGGIGKSTVASNLAAVWARRGLTVLQVGCDPKADSTLLLRHGEEVPSVLDCIRAGQPFDLDDVVRRGFAGVLCAEAGGPLPGLGCAGRGIITALEKLEQLGVYDLYKPDIVIFDVLGDVVCGGFALPMREGYANYVYVVTSGENMSIHAAANIGVAVDRFAQRGYARMGGLVLNRRDVRDEEAKVRELADDLHTHVVGDLPRSSVVTDAEEAGQVVMEYQPQGAMAHEYELLADRILADCGGAPLPGTGAPLPGSSAPSADCGEGDVAC